MKKVLLSCIILACIVLANAQCKYKIDFSMATFPSPITNGDTLFNGNPWGVNSRQEIQLPFSFQLFDASFQSVFYEATGRLVFDANHFYFVDAISCIAFIDEGFGTSTKTLSPIIVAVDSTDGKKKIRIRAQNVRLRNAPTKSVNYELQLHEDNTIHCFVGNHSNINPNTDVDFGPYTGVYNLESISPSIKFKPSQNILGTNGNYRDTCFIGDVSDFLNFEHGDFPDSDTKITISPLTSTHTYTIHLQSVTVTHQNGILYITSHKNLSCIASIVNISTGQQKEIEIEEGEAKVQLQPNTYYVLKMDGFRSVKFIVTN